MTGDELDRAIEFLLKQQSELRVDMAKLRDSQAETGLKLDALILKVDTLASTMDTQASTVDTVASTVDTLASIVDTLATTVDQLSDTIADGFIRTETQIESGWRETREAIDLIIANESTRDLAQKVAALSVQTSRVTNLEAKL